MCRINPRVDFAFKKLFGCEENKDLLISLLNAILSEEPPIVEVILKNPYNLADYKAGKLSIMDIKAQDNQGRWFNVEIQINEDLDFDKRALYYWAKLVTEQLSEGTMFKKLQKTFSINILNFTFVPNENFHNCYKIINTATGKDDKLHDVFELHYLELRKFKHDLNHLSNALDRWMTFLTRAHELDKNRLPPDLSADPAIVKAVRAVDRLFDEDDRLIYDVRLQTIATIESQIASALEKGLRKGLEQGIEQGIEQGRLASVRAIARSLLDILDAPTIAARTGLSVEEVDAMKNDTL